jgi:hypothetical protein
MSPLCAARLQSPGDIGPPCATAANDPKRKRHTIDILLRNNA